ncbi:unnamed protein product [Somion occarium]|uniref:CxC5 like cysteine cluster associated with KDZ domain-containing protein n=1 Tax=Somion occarium TaxID=3059160 RepID=A0ABP1DSV5_9APHY
MTATVRDFIFILETFFPGEMTLLRAFYVLATLVMLYPLLQLHQNQQKEPRQPNETAWKKAILPLLKRAFNPALSLPEAFDDTEQGFQTAEDLYHDIESVLEFLGIDTSINTLPDMFTPKPRIVLCTQRRNCIRCPPTTRFRSLRRRLSTSSVQVLTASLTWEDGELVVAHCSTCQADYYPDRITFKDENNRRVQWLEIDAPYLRVSKHGRWAARRVARLQESSLMRFHAGWAGFADLLNDVAEPVGQITNRQSQRLFLEYFARRLLVAHGKTRNFTCEAHPSARVFAERVRDVIGKNGGVMVSALRHTCMDCTHRKRYRSDLIAEGAILDDVGDRVAIEDNFEGIPGGERSLEDSDEVGANMPQLPPVQNEPPEDGQRGYVRMAVMDGKTIGHRVCAVDACENPLVNYKNGRFCEDHLYLRHICGIIPCGHQVGSNGLTCNDPVHETWYRQWKGRFTRMSYPGVRRVIRQQRSQQASGNLSNNRPTLQVQLAPLGEIPGEKVVHTFQAQSVYCLQTVQWACSMPIGWGKCYRSESAPQVLAILDRIWLDHPTLRPSFIAYDDACDLLRHIVTQDAQNPWLKSTKFVVDAWHYIGHRATDILCRVWCNPAPTNGSQPDLVIVEEDEEGARHQTRAFNTETAEQLNSWLDGFEAQLSQMTDVTYDFFVHVLFLVYGELVEHRIARKDRHLADDFWLEHETEEQ